jgi:hypothetical protein
MIRNEDGTWQRAPEDMSPDALLDVLNGDPKRYYLSAKDPNTPAAALLLGYVWDRPRDQPQEVQHGLTADLAERLAAGRKYAREHRQLRERAIEGELVNAETRETIPSAQYVETDHGE